MYSQQKPQWEMPLFFEDATGARDTVYIGYDSAASNEVYVIDTAFDEGWIRIDTTKFNAFLWIYPSYLPAGAYLLTSDSVRVKDISSFPYPYARIGFTGGKMPIVVKWVDSLLNSPALPFPDISPRPRARIDFYCESGEPGYINCPIEYDPISLTSYNTPDLKYVASDSLVFEGSGNYSPYKAIFNVFLQIVPHDYLLTSLSNQPYALNCTIYPNPVTKYLNISNPSNDNIKLTLYNLVGQAIIQNISSHLLISIDLSYFQDGIYILKLSNEKYIYTSKILKTHN